MRQAANRVGCEARIHRILIAAQLHAMDHQGYYPLVGVLPGYQPVDLNDKYCTKYDFFQDDSQAPYTRYPAPITVALSRQFSRQNLLADPGNNALGSEETDSQGFIKNFFCPAQASSTADFQQQPLLWSCGSGTSGGNIAYTQAQSYIYNEAICGWSDSTNPTGRLNGLARLVRQPSATMFIADGQQGYATETRIPFSAIQPPYPLAGMATLYNISATAPVTMADAFAGNGSGIGIAGDKANFDLQRHRGKINVGFCDGHVETRNITPVDLATVFLLAP